MQEIRLKHVKTEKASKTQTLFTRVRTFSAKFIITHQKGLWPAISLTLWIRLTSHTTHIGLTPIFLLFHGLGSCLNTFFYYTE
jgi:hypothetical protein